MKNKFDLVAWIFLLGGLLDFILGWASLLAQKEFWNIAPEFWFYDGIGMSLIALFFLLSSRYTK